MHFSKELDTTGLSCPLPILKTKKSLADMTSGEVLKIISTDSNSIKDIEAFSHQTGNTLLLSQSQNGKYVFFMQKK